MTVIWEMMSFTLLYKPHLQYTIVRERVYKLPLKQRGGMEKKKHVGVVSEKNKNMWGGVGDFFHCVPPQNLKWNSPYPHS